MRTRSSPEDEPVLLTVSPFQVTMGSLVGAPTALPEARIFVAYKAMTESCQIFWARQPNWRSLSRDCSRLCLKVWSLAIAQ